MIPIYTFKQLSPVWTKKDQLKAVTCGLTFLYKLCNQNVAEEFDITSLVHIETCRSRLGLITPWIVACPLPLVPAHLLYTILCPEKDKI